MCAGKSSNLLAREASGPEALNGRHGPMIYSRAAVNSSGAAYRVLRSGRQRPWRSVDREVVGRNESEAIELRHKRGLWVPRLYSKSKATRPSEEKAAHRSPSARHVTKADRGTQEIHREAMSDHQVGLQELIFKERMWPTMEVRWFRSSEEVE